ncbi:hypothetical protein HELRODRAFT_170324 [Helobdella robusta]|uniref:Endonuclease/exonuclease/phosphatase domain-containing protein n=1 Tax=Helobdella robusta TaxID=6412 RepID=T1F2X4_HELRO|nr:hypothetical protein HELRODRAFT_170324 [Helobdella robusta]ESO07772.1 hypothetical protein HELRODRAFT_170324 [Helobdella robusta]
MALQHVIKLNQIFYESTSFILKPSYSRKDLDCGAILSKLAAKMALDEPTGCNVKVIWPYSIIPCVVIFFGGLIIIFTSRLCQGVYKYFKKSRTTELRENRKPSAVQQIASYMKTDEEALDSICKSDSVDEDIAKRVKRKKLKIRFFFSQALAAQTIFGSIMIALSCLTSVISLVVYLIDASGVDPLETDFLVSIRVTDAVDLICNAFFLFHFILKQSLVPVPSSGKGGELTGACYTVLKKRCKHDGMILGEKAKKTLIEYNPVNDRLMFSRFKGYPRDIIVIVAYAPTLNHSDYEVVTFYEQLEQTLKALPKKDVKIIVGEWNAKIGSNNIGFEEVMGKYGVGDRGESLLEF